MTKSMKRYTLSSSPLCEQKRKIRSQKLGQIEELTEQYIRESDETIFNKLLGLDELTKADTVFLYHSVGREVSTVKLIVSILKSGKHVSLPVSGENGTMEFYPFGSLSELSPGKFGIPEPPATRPVRPKADDVIIVPALCCDKRGHRLGHGAGYYDRYLAMNKCFSICLCRKALLEHRLPTEDTDIAVSLVLTD